MSDRDVQRSKLYAAELTQRAEHSGRRFDVGDYEAVQLYVDKLCASRWFSNRYSQGSRKRTIKVKHRSRLRRAEGGWGSITLPTGDQAKWAWCEQVVLHEVAHCIVGPYGDGGWHGRTFARVYLDLIRHQLGDDAWHSMRDAYRKHRVKWHARRELTDEQRQAAADRLRARRKQAA